MRIGGTRKNGKVPRKYHITLGKIKKIGKRGDSYKVKFHDPNSQSTKLNWFFVEDLADLEKPNEHEIKRLKCVIQSCLNRLQEKTVIRIPWIKGLTKNLIHLEMAIVNLGQFRANLSL